MSDTCSLSYELRQALQKNNWILVVLNGPRCTWSVYLNLHVELIKFSLSNLPTENVKYNLRFYFSKKIAYCKKKETYDMLFGSKFMTCYNKEIGSIDHLSVVD